MTLAASLAGRLPTNLSLGLRIPSNVAKLVASRLGTITPRQNLDYSASAELLLSSTWLKKRLLTGASATIVVLPMHRRFAAAVWLFQFTLHLR